MKNKLLVANWKSNKTKNEAKTWLEEVSVQNFGDSLEMVILPPFTLLDCVNQYIKMNSLPFKIGAQDISPFDSGPYTGEVSAKQAKEFADYVLIGHSERRTNFGDSDEMVRKKVNLAIAEGITPIVCFSNASQLDGLESKKEIVFAYEPKGAISTSGPNAQPENPSLVSEFVQKIKEKILSEVIYGGSVNSNNVKEYLDLENISGALIGGQSLDPVNFINIIKNAS